MLTSEETRILTYLRRRFVAEATDVARACGDTGPRPWLVRVVGNLDWHGYVTAYHDRLGNLTAVQLTEKGLSAVGGRRQPA